jgi:hypothetical protein
VTWNLVERPAQLRALTDEIALQIFAAVKDKAVLVGGQSLAFWVSKYEIPIYEGYAAISMDADYLGDHDDVDTIGNCFKSVVTFPHKTAITALVGSVHIIPDDESYMNVDVIHKIIGLKAAAVRARAVDVETDGVLIRVMHPLHVLASRVINFYKLAEKQTDVGLMQMKLSIQVAWHYAVDVAHNMDGGQKAALKIIEEIVTLAKTSPGRFAKLNGINFLEAIPYDAISSANFHTIRLPRLIDELERTKPQKNRVPI